MWVTSDRMLFSCGNMSSFFRHLFRTKLVQFSATVIFFENIPFLEFQRNVFFVLNQIIKLHVSVYLSNTPIIKLHVSVCLSSTPIIKMHVSV